MLAIPLSPKSLSIKIHTHDCTTQMLHTLKCHPKRNCLEALRHFSELRPYRYRSSHFSSRRAERGPLASAGYRKNIALRKIPIPTHLSRLNLQLHSLHSHSPPNNSHTDKMAELTHPTIKDGKISPNPIPPQWLARRGVVAPNACEIQSLT